MKILIIEDEVRLADSVKALLERKGFDVQAVYDGETGAEYAELGVYDLLILDVMMPKMDGFELAELDLKLRGPGEVAGIQQSGYLSLGLSDPVQDKELLEIARSEVLATLN